DLTRQNAFYYGHVIAPFVVGIPKDAATVKQQQNKRIKPNRQCCAAFTSKKSELRRTLCKRHYLKPNSQRKYTKNAHKKSSVIANRAFLEFGGPGKIRTCDQWAKSQLSNR